MSSGFEDGPYYFGLIGDESCPFLQVLIGHYNLKKSDLMSLWMKFVLSIYLRLRNSKWKKKVYFW